MEEVALDRQKRPGHISERYGRASLTCSKLMA